MDNATHTTPIENEDEIASSASSMLDEYVDKEATATDDEPTPETEAASALKSMQEVTAMAPDELAVPSMSTLTMLTGGTSLAIVQTDKASTSDISAITAATLAPKAAKPKKPKNDILLADPISKAAHTIENLDAAAAKTMSFELVDGSEFSTFQLGGVLARVNEQGFFQEYGYDDFKSWVEAAHGFKYRKAMHLIEIYEAVNHLNLPWDKIKHIGWTKLKTLLAPKLNLVTKDNLDGWVEKASSMTVFQLEAHIDGLSKANDGMAIEQDAGKTVTSLTFKLHADQKEMIRSALELAKEKSGTAVDTVALEMIALEFLGKPTVVKSHGMSEDELAEFKKSLANSPHSGPVIMEEPVEPPAWVAETTAEVLGASLKAMGADKVLAAWEIAFPNVTIEVTFD